MDSRKPKLVSPMPLILPALSTRRRRLAVAKTISQLRDWEEKLSKLSDDKLGSAIVPYIVDWITGAEGITDFGDVKPTWVAEKLVDPVVKSLRGM